MTIPAGAPDPVAFNAAQEDATPVALICDEILAAARRGPVDMLPSRGHLSEWREWLTYRASTLGDRIPGKGMFTSAYRRHLVELGALAVKAIEAHDAERAEATGKPRSALVEIKLGMSREQIEDAIADALIFAGFRDIPAASAATPGATS